MEESSKTERALIEELASLRQRILELEQSQAAKTIAELHKEAALNELRVSENKYRKIVENAYDQIMYMDLDGIIQYANRAACDLAGPLNLIGLPMRTVISHDQLKRHEELLHRRKEGDLTDYSFEWELIPPGGDRSLIMDVRSSALIENGKPSGVLLIARDITDRKLREEESQALAKNLEETNIALRVLLKKGDKDREKLEESLQSNVNQLVMPFLSKLRESQSNHERLTYLNILETNLSNIVSPFINQLSSVYKNLTPKETQIAELIRQGKRSKEIAEIMNISVRTVDVLRYSVRKKLGLNKKKANLQSLLSSL